MTILVLFFWSGVFFRLGLSMGFSEMEFLGQIASFERRLRGTAPTPLPSLIRSAPNRERG